MAHINKFVIHPVPKTRLFTICSDRKPKCRPCNIFPMRSNDQKLEMPLIRQPGVAHVMNIKEKSSEDRKILAELNDRFAEYLCKVKYLEGINKKLSSELHRLKFTEASNFASSESFLFNRKAELLDDISHAKNENIILAEEVNSLNVRLLSVKSTLNDCKNPGYKQHKDEMTRLKKTISDYERKIFESKRRCEEVETEIEASRFESSVLENHISILTREVNNEAVQVQILHAEWSLLEQELERIKDSHKFEMNNVRLNFLASSIHPNPFLKSQLVSNIKEIREQYENNLEQQRLHLQAQYQAKANQLRNTFVSLQNNKSLTETEQIREISKAISDAKARIAGLEVEGKELDSQIEQVRKHIYDRKEDDERYLAAEIKKYQESISNLHDAVNDLSKYKQTMEYEIGRYRKLLDGNANGIGLRYYDQNLETLTKQPEHKFPYNFEVVESNSFFFPEQDALKLDVQNTPCDVYHEEVEDLKIINSSAVVNDLNRECSGYHSGTIPHGGFYT